jgi:molybdenum cofactor synthesis domain-containing protein
MIVIGDEILSGRTQDTNTHYLAGQLTEVGIDLMEVRVVSDDHKTISTTVREISARYDHVFTSGGIGPTHDDITADAVGDAFEAKVGIRDDVHVMAGVPSVFKAMVASVLPTMTGGQPLLSVTLRVDRGEGDIAGPLSDMVEKFPDISFGSYPFQKDGKYGSNLVLRGTDVSALEVARNDLARALGVPVS